MDLGFKPFDEALNEMQQVIILSLGDEDHSRMEVPTEALLSIINEAVDMKRELRAITTREEWYINNKQWDEMVPWFDMSPQEKIAAIEFWSEP